MMGHSQLLYVASTSLKGEKGALLVTQEIGVIKVPPTLTEAVLRH